MSETLALLMRFVIVLLGLGGAFYLYTRWMSKRLETILAPPDVAAPPDDAEPHRDIFSRVLKEGSGGVRPAHDDVVTVHYTGWTTDGEMFDSSITRGMPATFPIDALIEGWRRGLLLMQKGEKRRLWIPAALAYGELPNAAGPCGMLVFDVELLAIGSEALDASWQDATERDHEDALLLPADEES